MCGREPNFELSEEEKQELSKFKWDEFLAITRSAINNKSNNTLSTTMQPIFHHLYPCFFLSDVYILQNLQNIEETE